MIGRSAEARFVVVGMDIIGSFRLSSDGRTRSLGSEIGGKKSCANIMAGSKAKMAGRRFSDVVAKTMVAKMAGTPSVHLTLKLKAQTLKLKEVHHDHDHGRRLPPPPISRQ